MFRWDTEVVGDSDGFRYTVLQPAGSAPLAGIMDASAFLPAGGSAWSVYWETADVDAAVATVRSLGGQVTSEPTDTPYGRMAAVADPWGATFKLRTGPTG